MKLSDRKLKIGVIGCGHWGKHYVRLFSSLQGAQLTAISDIDTSKLRLIAQSYPGADVFADYRKMLSGCCCDAVVVATNAATHYKIVKDALRAGMDVLAEKPLTLKSRESLELARMARRTKKILMVAHTFLFNPSIVQIKKYFSRGVIGNIYYLKAQRTHLGLIREDVNAVWDLAPHDISIFLYLLGEKPKIIQAVGRRVLRENRDDAAFINMVFPSGVMAHIHVSWADSNKERFLDIVGSKARVIFDDLNMQEPIRLFRKGISVEPGRETSFGEFKYLFRDGDIISPVIPVEEALKVLCQTFLSSLRTRKPHFSDGFFGHDVVEVLCQIDDELKKSRSSIGS